MILFGTTIFDISQIFLKSSVHNTNIGVERAVRRASLILESFFSENIEVVVRAFEELA